MDTIGSRLKAARKTAKLTQQQLADALRIDRVNVSQWESDTTKPAQERYTTLANILGVDKLWLMFGESEVRARDSHEPDIVLSRSDGTTVLAEVKQRVPITPGRELLGTGKMPLYTGAMGGDGHVIVTFDAIDYVKRPAELENVKGGYGLLIVGESMIPAFWPGDMALVNPHLPPARQKNVILYHTPPNGGDTEAIVKQLNGWTDREWMLQQYNPAREFTEFRHEWPICHRVVGKYDAR